MRKVNRQVASPGAEQFAVHMADRPGIGPEITVFGELDAATGPELQEVIDQALDAEGEVLIDLRACGFVDSHGIAVLARAAVQLDEDGRKLVIRGVQARVQRIFDLAGLAAQDSVTLEPE